MFPRRFLAVVALAIGSPTAWTAARPAEHELLAGPELHTVRAFPAVTLYTSNELRMIFLDPRTGQYDHFGPTFRWQGIPELSITSFCWHPQLGLVATFLYGRIFLVQVNPQTAVLTEITQLGILQEGGNGTTDGFTSLTYDPTTGLLWMVHLGSTQVGNQPASYWAYASRIDYFNREAGSYIDLYALPFGARIGFDLQGNLWASDGKRLWNVFSGQTVGNLVTTDDHPLQVVFELTVHPCTGEMYVTGEDDRGLVWGILDTQTAVVTPLQPVVPFLAVFIPNAAIP